MSEFTKEQGGVGAYCPFCGDERNLVEIGVPFEICHVECARCGAHGPVESAEDRAISAWNVRIGGPVERPALNAKEFSREELEILSCLSAFESNPVVRLAQVSAFALSLLERAENAEAERDRLKGELAEAEEAILLIERITVTYEDARGDGESEGVAKIGQEFLDHPAVRRARERGK